MTYRNESYLGRRRFSFVLRFFSHAIVYIEWVSGKLKLNKISKKAVRLSCMDKVRLGNRSNVVLLINILKHLSHRMKM